MNASFPGHKPKQDGIKLRSISELQNPTPNNDQTGKKKKAYDPSKPCHYCSELGHWTPTCLVKIKANKSRLKFKEHAANVASFDTSPSIESLEAFLYSGATYSVVGDISLFTSISTTNMILSVTSNHKSVVVRIGRINLKIGDNILEVKDVLYCKEIPGIIILIEKLLDQLIYVEFYNNKFVLNQSGNMFTSFDKNSQWFLPVSFPSTISAIAPVP
ncbi:hypothetical protein O181_093020 [Austropuccinia psidii MF-1]|uniref:Gag-pol polyprotein n=1 Tax=Austropuccinia psidii MF-1 TaxID=1389203 RepID=A0A9Q3IZL8_9BASI|nr:hypothetical protein [Austropuccinia psidii MF-1]